jgi:hypothetical protein
VYHVRLTVTDGNRVRLCLGTLAIRRAHRRVDVPERIHAFNLDQPSLGVVDQADVSGQRRIGGSGRQFECASVAARPPQPQDQLLDRQMACIDRLLQGVPTECQIQPQVESDRNTLPGLEGQSAAIAALDLTDRRLSQADPSAELLLSPSTAFPSPPDVRASAHEEGASATHQPAEWFACAWPYRDQHCSKHLAAP